MKIMMNNFKNKKWAIEDEQKVQYQWASRTFTSTCLKLTLQNETVSREIDNQHEYLNKRNKNKKIQIYSFLENFYLHTMFNKSQKVLLGFTDVRPCVILSMDNFMFTPPPVLFSQSEIYQSETELFDTEEKEEEEEEKDIFKATISNIIMPIVKHDDQQNDSFRDENTWMAVNNSSIIGIVAEYQGDDKDDVLLPHNSERSTITSDLLDRYKSNEDISSHHQTTSTIIFDNNNDKHQSIIQSQQTEGSSWFKKIQYSFIFISKRLIEAAYLVLELAESFTNKKNCNELTSTTEHHQLEHHHSNTNDDYNYHSITGKCIMLIFRMWRIFFLGIEIAINQLVTTTCSIDNHYLLPTLLITANTI